MPAVASRTVSVRPSVGAFFGRAARTTSSPFRLFGAVRGSRREKSPRSFCPSADVRRKPETVCVGDEDRFYIILKLHQGPFCKAGFTGEG